MGLRYNYYRTCVCMSVCYSFAGYEGTYDSRGDDDGRSPQSDGGRSKGTWQTSSHVATQSFRCVDLII